MHSVYKKDGTKHIADNTLVALTLMIAESRTEEKDTMVKVIVNQEQLTGFCFDKSHYRKLYCTLPSNLPIAQI